MATCIACQRLGRATVVQDVTMQQKMRALAPSSQATMPTGPGACERVWSMYPAGIQGAGTCLCRRRAAVVYVEERRAALPNTVGCVGGWDRFGAGTTLRRCRVPRGWVRSQACILLRSVASTPAAFLGHWSLAPLPSQLTYACMRCALTASPTWTTTPARWPPCLSMMLTTMPDAKERFFWRVGPRPKETQFPELNAAPVIPQVGLSGGQGCVCVARARARAEGGAALPHLFS